MSIAHAWASNARSGVLLSGDEQRSLGIRLVFSLIASGLLILSLGVRVFCPGEPAIAELTAGLAAGLVAIPAFAAGLRSLRFPNLHGITDQLVALTLLAAWASGDLVTAALLPIVMMIGHALEERSLLGSQEAIRALTNLTGINARRLRGNGEVEQVAAQELRPGDRIEIRPGDHVPSDGVIETGVSSVDTASLTGESIPADVRPGEEVFSGSTNLDGYLTVRVTRVGDESVLGRVVGLMQEAENAKPPITRLLERHAPRYVLLVLLLTACAWFFTGSTAVLLAVLVAACPCALVLAAPATSIAAIAVAGRHGILIKGASFLEDLGTVDSVIFDKTGTLTLGQLRLAGSALEPGVEREQVLRLASSIGRASSHPVSRVLAACTPEGERLPVTDVQETGGLGLIGKVGQERIGIGRRELFKQLGVDAPEPPEHPGPIVGVCLGPRFLGWLLLADQPRPEAHAALAALRELGIRRQIILTGDRAAEAWRIACTLDVTDVRPEALPAQKMLCVLDEIKAGHRPLVVGDGLNDVLALKASAVAVAMGAQVTDVAMASADLVLMTHDLRRLATCIRLSRRCRQTIYTNVALGFGWTATVIALAATGVLGPSGALVAALLHNLGTVAVVANAGRLLKFQEILSPIPASQSKI